MSDPAHADIRIGWGAFDTLTTGVIGFTTSHHADGAIQSGALIRLEDLGETALVDTADGPAYAGTDATLYQVLLHEIGHALGLADVSDPHAALFYALSQDNRTLDATDIAAIRLAYGQGAAALSYGSPGQAATPAGPSSAPLAGIASPWPDQVLAGNLLH